MFSALRLPLEFDAVRLQQDLSALTPDDWSPHYNKGDYGGTWRGAALRSGSGATRDLTAMPAEAGFLETPLLSRCPYLREVLAAFPCPLRSVRLLALAPGSFIREHVDHALDYEDGQVRIHIPMQTNPGVEFFLSGERVALEPGRAYYLNVNLPHRVNNRGQTERIHLVIDADVDEWIVELFARSENAPRCTPVGPDVAAFRDLMLADPALREKLRGIDDGQEFAAESVRLGRAAGFELHEGDIDAFLRGPAQPGEAGGLPIGFTVRDGTPYVEWIDIGEQPIDPLFDDMLRVCTKRPFVRLSRREARLACADAPPAGFIFHLSRCGSTLVARLFQAAGMRVIAEAPPVDRAVQAGRADWLRWLVAAFGGGTPYLVKLDSWHIHSFPLIRAAFPAVPWVFLFRDPREVLLSHRRSPGMQSLPGALDPQLLRVSSETAFLHRDEWCAHVLAALCRSALEHLDEGGLAVDYRDLPGAADSIARHFGIALDDAARERMAGAAKFDAKKPGSMFHRDPIEEESAKLADLAARTGLPPLYEALCAERDSRMASSRL